MKKKLLSILLCLLLIIPPISLDAGGMDLINNAIHNKITDTRGRDLINKALGKDSQDVKIIKTKKEVSELKKANKKPIQQKKAKEVLLGLDISKWNGNIDWKSVKKLELSLLSLELAMVQTMQTLISRRTQRVQQLMTC